MFSEFLGWFSVENKKKSPRGSFLEEGVPGDAVQQVVRLSPGGLSKGKHLLLRHAGGNGDVALLKGRQVLVWRDRVGITNG